MDKLTRITIHEELCRMVSLFASVARVPEHYQVIADYLEAHDRACEALAQEAKLDNSLEGDIGERC